METAGPATWAERYKCMQLLQIRANEIFKYPLVSIKVMFLLAAIRCVYGMVKMEGLFRIFNFNAATTLLIFLAVAFKALGAVYKKSVEELFQHRRVLNNKWFRRFGRSCRPLKLEIGGLYFVDSPMSLTMGSFVIQNVANLLTFEA